MATVTKKKPTKAPANVLIVDDEPLLVELVQDIIARKVNCKVVAARDINEANQILQSQPIELMMTDLHLPDGNGIELLPTLHKLQPTASAIVITGDPSMDGAIDAMRNGAADFVPKPFSAEKLTERVRKALEQQAANKRAQERLDKLRQAVRRLNEARRIVTRKVDLLCNDLITAYGELSRQFDSVRTQQAFRAYCDQARDLEQLLCHSMDWILRQIGYSNVAIWLAADDADFQLGAYMKYTIPGDEPLCEALRTGLLPQTIQQGVLHLDADEAQQKMTPAELKFLRGQTVLAINCTYLGEPLAALILFREGDKPFTDEDEEVLKMISPVFACALASAVRDQENSEGGSGEESESEEGEPGGEGRKKDDRGEADWWKRGEPPPF